MRFVDTERRARILMQRNKRGETTLHCAAALGVRAGLDPKTCPVARTLQVRRRGDRQTDRLHALIGTR